MKKKRDILTCEDIGNLQNINRGMVKEYLTWGEQNLADCLQTKRDIEKKSSSLFLSYMIAFMALIFMKLQFSISFFHIPPVFFGISLICLLFSMNFSAYGTLGKNPRSWLYKNTDYNYLIINEDNDAYIYAYRLHELVKTIEISDKSNYYKMKLIQVSLVSATFGLIGLFFL